MSTPSAVDIVALLAPIAESNPSGEPLRDTAAYDAIKEARRSENILNQGEWKRDVKVANWRATIERAVEALTHKTKDIQIAAWLTEALANQCGFAGLRDGLRILRELQETYWDSLYPLPEDSDLESRAAPLDWLNNKLPSSLIGIGLTRPKGDGRSYSWLSWQESKALDELGRKDPEAKNAAIEEGKVTAEQFEKAVAATPIEFYGELLDDVTDCLDQCETLTAVIDQKFGPEAAPSLRDIKNTLEDCRDLIQEIIGRKGGSLPSSVPASSNNGAALPAKAINSEVALSGERSLPRNAALGAEPFDRADALRQLELIAEFFHRTEPHSPVAYLVQRAVRWGQMPLEQWLDEVIGDEAVKAHIRETLGIKNSEQTGG